ncbi:MAG TPA: glycine--tRNA ligase [Candidatus Paceibacterota bacterium]|nr:glycine--tRNA ligase [Candidatus Paceibacterota bacterium]
MKDKKTNKAETETISNGMEKIVSLCKRRGFVFPGSEIYGGLANSWDYGPLGVELKNNIKQAWWDRFVRRRSDMVGIDAALIMNPKVWEASGHLATFSDPLVECKKCHERFRADNIDIDAPCAKCGAKGQFTESKQFNLMLKTFLGPAEEQANVAYFRPEIAQSMFVNFKKVLDTTRRRLPFGIASQGKAFRNEITPGNFIFRTREFDLMEFEYFIEEKEWEKWFEYWQKEMMEWITKDLGINPKKVHEVEVPKEDRAHYSKRTVDFEYDYPFGQKELYGLAYRTDFDLKNHEKFSGQNLKYRDPETGEEFFPHVIEPSFGLDRSVLATLVDAYYEDGGHVVLKLPFKLAPYKAAVFPLLANKPELVELAQKIHGDLLKSFPVAWDDRGNIGKRYYSQDEIGTPFCITVDFDSLENGDVTVRDRDTAKQERIKIKELTEYINGKISG